MLFDRGEELLDPTSLPFHSAPSIYSIPWHSPTSLPIPLGSAANQHTTQPLICSSPSHPRSSEIRRRFGGGRSIRSGDRPGGSQLLPGWPPGRAGAAGPGGERRAERGEGVRAVGERFVRKMKDVITVDKLDVENSDPVNSGVAVVE